MLLNVDLVDRRGIFGRLGSGKKNCVQWWRKRLQIKHVKTVFQISM